MKTFKENINQSFSSHFEKLGKIFSCKQSCKVDDLFEDNKENKKPTSNQKNYCNDHIKPLSYYCKSCKMFLCVLCCSEHSNFKSSNHEFIELQNMDSFIIHEVERLAKESITIQEKLQTDEKLQSLPDYQKEFEEGLETLSLLKKECIEKIENHFNSLSEDYLNLFKSLPCKFQKDALSIAINDYIHKIQTIEKKERESNNIENKKKKMKNIYDYIPEIKKFNEIQLENEFEILKKSFNVLVNFQNISQKKAVLPKINVNPIQKFESNLIDWVSLIGPTDNPYDQFKKIRLSLENYFNPQYENYLARADSFNEQLILYNISTQSEEKVCLAAESEIPTDHALIVTPNLDILIVGGQKKDKTISKDVFFCSPLSSNPESEGEDLALVKKANMEFERIDHAVCLAENVLFCFGGRNNQFDVLNSCEKYLIAEDKWENIAPMNFGRKKLGATTFNNSFIYVFFGCENDNFEKYDIRKNCWEVIQPINSHVCFKANHVGCLQINPNQILIVGGTQEKTIENERKEEEGVKRGILYNVSENNLINLGSVMGVELNNPSQMIISHKNIYCLGRTDSSNKNENEWIFRMKNGRSFETLGLIHYSKTT